MAQEGLSAAQTTLKAAQATVDAARVSLDAVNAVLQAVSDTYKLGSDVAGKITSFGINGLVSIHEITFNAELSVANGGSFSGSVKARFLGHAQVTVRININLRDITAMAKQLADEIGAGFSSLF